MGVYPFPAAAPRPRRVMLLNAKGGCGKSMLATHLAGYYASRGLGTTIIDHDQQQAALRWLSLRPPERPVIHGIAARRTSAQVTRAWQMRPPEGTERVVIDTPAGLAGFELARMVREADVILIPVLASDNDIHAVSRFVADLLLEGRVRTMPVRVGLVANRVRRNTRIFDALRRFLARLRFPFVTTLRDTQHYVHAARGGLGIHELKPTPRLAPDLESWTRLTDWIEHDEVPAGSEGPLEPARPTSPHADHAS